MLLTAHCIRHPTVARMSGMPLLLFAWTQTFPRVGYSPELLLRSAVAIPQPRLAGSSPLRSQARSLFLLLGHYPARSFEMSCGPHRSRTAKSTPVLGTCIEAVLLEAV